MTCPGCGHEVPTGRFCVRCGSALAAEEARSGRGFAAAPHEQILVPRVVSTLFPHLTRGELKPYRLAFAAGAATMAGLALAGLYPLALVAAAVFVPLVVLLYFWAVDVYEDEPALVLALTIAWGAVTGVAFGFITRTVQADDAGVVSRTAAHALVWNGVLLPAIGFVLAIAGPLAMLPYRKFNDVLDGVTFGGASAVAFAGAALLVRSADFLGAGLEPVGGTLPWVLRILTLGIALPVLTAAAVGAAAGSAWLRFRAPVHDRSKLGALAHPALAALLAAGALLGAGLVQLYLGRWEAFLVLLALDAGALLWLRALIQIGLTEEAEERPISGESRCANCGATTPRHTFCVNCGVALRATPKGESRPIHAVFAGALALSIGAALATILLVRPGETQPFCAGKSHCAGPPGPALLPTRSPALVNGTTWTTPLGVRLEYEPSIWDAQEIQDNGVVGILLAAAGRLAGTDFRVLFSVRRSGSEPLESLLQRQRAAFQGLYPSLTADSAQNQILGPAIGSRFGIGEVDAGTTADESNPVEVMIEAARGDGVDVAMAAWTDNPRAFSGSDSPYPVFGLADGILETFRWPSEHVR